MKDYKHQSASRGIWKHFIRICKTGILKLCMKTLVCSRNCLVLLKKLKNLMRVWRHLQQTIFNPLNWVPTIFPWDQGGTRCTCTKFILCLSGYNQYSRWITGSILWPSEWFISTWYFSWNAAFSALVNCAWIIPTTVWTSFSNIASVATTNLCKCGFSALLDITTKARNERKVEDDITLALSNTQPRIMKMATRLQSKPWHWKYLWNPIAVWN